MKVIGDLQTCNKKQLQKCEYIRFCLIRKSYNKRFYCFSNEAMLQSGASFSLTSSEMENHIFTKSDNRDEYISFVTRLILHVHEMGKLKKIQIPSEVPEPTEKMEISHVPEKIEEATTHDNSLTLKIKNDEYDWKSPMFRKNILEKM